MTLPIGVSCLSNLAIVASIAQADGSWPMLSTTLVRVHGRDALFTKQFFLLVGIRSRDSSTSARAFFLASFLVVRFIVAPAYGLIPSPALFVPPRVRFSCE